MSTSLELQVATNATAQLLAEVRQIEEETSDQFTLAQQLVYRLGAHWQAATATAAFGFWLPDLVESAADQAQVFLELLRPLDPVDFDRAEQTVRFARQRLPLRIVSNYGWLVVNGAVAGRRDQVGDFYRVVWQIRSGLWRYRLDPLAHSLPFGGYAPAELYDMDTLQAGRADSAYFQTQLDTNLDPDGIPRVNAPANMLEIHVNTATQAGTLAALTSVYETISGKHVRGEPLTPLESAYVGYDAVQLMPIEPCIVHEAKPGYFWEEQSSATGAVTATLRRPDTTNWGYDVLIAGSPAINPTVLGSKRPDELVAFITALHNFRPKPIKVVLDIVYGHADNQSLPLLNRHFFAGANMYGQNLQYKQPVVRAILLEMQRRKSNYGFDGLRVDGAQDFKYWLPETDELRHDDDFLIQMNNLEQEVAGVSYRPWMIFEDGRPWPRADWELASSYREVTKIQANVVQWGPLTFAHNTPFLFTFWVSKLWRVREMMGVGSHWLTGSANHDTLRRGTQVDPASRVNTYLGARLPEIFKKAYDNPAALLFGYVMAPGIPMDFLQANLRVPWSFMRNTDDRYGVKVVSEEAAFLHWAVDESTFAAVDAFSRLKGLGFGSYEGLKQFLRALENSVKMTEYDLPLMAGLLTELALLPEPLDAIWLKRMARAWMDDIHDYCNVSRWEKELNSGQLAFARQAREFRRARPYLRANLAAAEHFACREPADGSALFYGLRRDPAGAEQLLFVANMEGAPCTIVPTELPIPGLPAAGWSPVLMAPGLDRREAGESLTLADSQAVVYARQ